MAEGGGRKDSHVAEEAAATQGRDGRTRGGRYHDGGALTIYTRPPFGHIETRALLGGIIVVAVKSGLGEYSLKSFYKGDEGTLLRLIKCVGRTAPTVETANVADADAVLIVPIGMGSHLFDGAAGMEGAVEVDDEMIAYVLESPFEMPAAYLFDGVVSVFAGGCAVDNDIVNFSHGGGVLIVLCGEENGKVYRQGAKSGVIISFSYGGFRHR